MPFVVDSHRSVPSGARTEIPVSQSFSVCFFQALRIGEVQRRVLCQLMHRYRRAAERFGSNDIVVLFKAGGLRFDKIKGLAETSLRCAQCPPIREKNDAGHKKHTDDQIDPPSPCI